MLTTKTTAIKNTKGSSREAEFDAGPATYEDWRKLEDQAQDVGEDLLANFRNRVSRAGMPPRFKYYILGQNSEEGLRAAWRDYKDKETALSIACELFDPPSSAPSVRNALLLIGGFGTGKTTLACALLKHYMWKYQEEGLFLKFYQFIRLVQSGYSTGLADEALKTAQRAPILVLDDIGELERRVSQSEDRKQLLFEVLDHRNDHFLPTILTTNLDVKGLIEQFTERTFQRIMEMCQMVHLEGKNFRL